ncbi:MAG: cysteine rich repeat-containing protein [Pseudolabrys sp.]
MYLKFCAVLVLIQIVTTAAFAVDEKRRSPQQGGFLSGTPEEQAACAPDSTKFCRDVIPDTLRVLACLQEHRKSLRKVCLKVLEDHGQ